MTPAERYLAEIRLELARAENALADEHEGNLRAAVFNLNEAAQALQQMVRTW